jgi:hypothetical protein
MKYFYQGSFDNLKSDLNDKVSKHNHEMHTDYRIFKLSTSNLSFGIQRLGHSDGKFFNAEITFDDKCVVLNGSICEERHSSNASIGDKTEEFILNLFLHAVYYAVAGGIIFGICILLNFSNYVLPIVLPTLVLVFFRLRAVKEEKRQDIQFHEFMSNYLGCSYQM